MKLTRDNYYSAEADAAYWSASFVKEMLDCPARALAELNGEYTRGDSSALLVGGYVDAYFDGTLDDWCAEHPQVFNSRTGALKAEYAFADDMIARAGEDGLFMSFLDGERQAIKTGTIGGIPFKCKMDFYKPGERIVDLKTVKNMEPMYKPEEGRLSFVEYWRWDLQMAIYQHIEGNRLPCYLAVITKENPPDIAVIQIPQHVLDTEIKILEDKLPQLNAMRQGVIPPHRCGRCAYCRKTHKLSGVINLDEIMEVGL